MIPILLLLGPPAARAQTIDVQVSVTSLSPPRVRIAGKRAAGAKTWSFLNVYAGVMGLGGRVENFSLADAALKDVPVRLLAPGEYEAEREATHFQYDLKLHPPARTTDAAHVSWLTEERGLLLLADLLPRPLARANVRFEIPAGWALASAENEKTPRQFEVAEADDSVFFIGRELRGKRARAGGMDYTCVTTGVWSFGDDDLARAVSDILKDYQGVLGGMPRKRAAVFVSPFPSAASAQTWSAETRGGSVILLSGQWPSKTIALSRLDGILSHELLHLWVPNGLSLDGEYGWFYEGFTLYQSLRAGVRRGQLTFQDYLNAIARAYDGYRAGRNSLTISLVEASRRRWSLSPSLIYDQGMLVAFLYDLSLMQRTGGKSGIAEVYRALFRQYGNGGAREEGNRAAIGTLKSFDGMENFVSRYLENTLPIDLSSEVLSFGLRLENVGNRTRLIVSDSVTNSQGDLLRKLGYNNKTGTAPGRARERS